MAVSLIQYAGKRPVSPQLSTETLFRDSYRAVEDAQHAARRNDAVLLLLNNCHRTIQDLERVYNLRTKVVPQPVLNREDDVFQVRKSLADFTATCNIAQLHLGGAHPSASPHIDGCLPGPQWSRKKKHSKALEQEVAEHLRTLYLVLTNIIYITSLAEQRRNVFDDPTLTFILRQVEKRHAAFERMSSSQLLDLYRMDSSRNEQDGWDFCLRRYFDYFDAYTQSKAHLITSDPPHQQYPPFHSRSRSFSGPMHPKDSIGGTRSFNPSMAYAEIQDVRILPSEHPRVPASSRPTYDSRSSSETSLPRITSSSNIAGSGAPIPILGRHSIDDPFCGPRSNQFGASTVHAPKAPTVPNRSSSTTPLTTPVLQPASFAQPHDHVQLPSMIPAARVNPVNSSVPAPVVRQYEIPWERLAMDFNGAFINDLVLRWPEIWQLQQDLIWESRNMTAMEARQHVHAWMDRLPQEAAQTLRQRLITQRSPTAVEVEAFPQETTTKRVDSGIGRSPPRRRSVSLRPSRQTSLENDRADVSSDVAIQLTDMLDAQLSQDKPSKKELAKRKAREERISREIEHERLAREEQEAKGWALAARKARERAERRVQAIERRAEEGRVIAAQRRRAKSQAAGVLDDIDGQSLQPFQDPITQGYHAPQPFQQSVQDHYWTHSAMPLPTSGAISRQNIYDATNQSLVGVDGSDRKPNIFSSLSSRLSHQTSATPAMRKHFSFKDTIRLVPKSPHAEPEWGQHQTDPLERVREAEKQKKAGRLTNPEHTLISLREQHPQRSFLHEQNSKPALRRVETLKSSQMRKKGRIGSIVQRSLRPRPLSAISERQSIYSRSSFAQSRSTDQIAACHASDKAVTSPRAESVMSSTDLELVLEVKHVSEEDPCHSFSSASTFSDDLTALSSSATTISEPPLLSPTTIVKNYPAPLGSHPVDEIQESYGEGHTEEELLDSSVAVPLVESHKKSKKGHCLFTTTDTDDLEVNGHETTNSDITTRAALPAPLITARQAAEREKMIKRKEVPGSMLGPLKMDDIVNDQSSSWSYSFWLSALPRLEGVLTSPLRSKGF